jgi:serine protease inhibitor
MTILQGLPILLASALVLVGCSNDPPKGPRTGKGHPVVSDDELGPPPSLVVDDAAKAGVPKLVEARNAFAIDLYSHLRQRDGNLFFSPASASSALSMLSIGARGETASQIERILHAPGDVRRTDAAHAALLQSLTEEEHVGDARFQRVPRCRLRIADALWVQSGYPILGEMSDLLKDRYGASITSVDFQGAPDEALRLIDAWVIKRTLGKFKNSISREDIDPAHTKLVLTDAIYFRETWAAPFWEKSTAEEDFRISPTRTGRVRMMHQTIERNLYADEGTFQVLDLSYTDGRFSMVVLLPRTVDGLAALESSLTAAGLAATLSRLKEREEVIVSIPRFSIRSELSLDSVLSEMGMPLAFGPSADFSGVTGTKNDLFLSKAVQTATIDVDEKGTEAAAFTGFSSWDSYGDDKPPVFHADHPFLFLIRDLRSGAILFMGRLTNPE